ncbi:MAG TPA: hypothetical protein VFX49_00070 [Chloroflexota bacterium]|nr:hypothetical protein [Chloroflexota bacterium]
MTEARSLPMEEFEDFLRRLHAGPPQHAAAVKVAVAVWQGALGRGDAEGAAAALQMVRDEVDRLIRSISELQERGRRLAGQA